MPQKKKRTANYSRQDAVRLMAKKRQRDAREALRVIKTALKYWAARRD